MQVDVVIALQEALALHKAGRLPEARAAYETILAVDPDNFTCLHYTGVIAFQEGRYADAVRDLDRAAEVNETVAEVFNLRGGALSWLQRYEEALASFDRALVLDPTHSEALNNRGGALAMLGRHTEAVVVFDTLIARAPDNPDLRCSRGRSHGALGHHAEAIADFDRAIALAPDNADAHYNRGSVLWAMGQHDLATASYERAAALQPDNVTVIWNRGVALSRQGLYNDAVPNFERVIALDPKNTDAYNELGIAHLELRHIDKAIACFRHAITIVSDHVAAHTNLGRAHFIAGRYTEALQSSDRAIAIEPDHIHAILNRGLILENLGRPEESLESYDRALTIDPVTKYGRGKRIHGRMRIGRWDDFEAEVHAISHNIAAGHLVIDTFPMLSLPSTPTQQLRTSELRRKDAAASDDAPLASPRQGRSKIRIGYFSADFRNHAVSNLIAHLIEIHDRQNFEIIGFSFLPGMADDMTERMRKAFDSFIEVSADSDEEIAARARAMEIDIAIDLTGDTADGRAGIFLRRAAPIQVNYLGYPGTMGSPLYDYIIADSILIPPAHRQAYAEKIAYLPHCYQPNDSGRVISERILTRSDLGLPVSAFVFCAFNNAFKITPLVFDIWMRLLHKVDGSILWLLDGPAPLAANLRREAEKRGISGNRLIFAPRIKPSEHLARHRAADLFLDTFYYNAHTTGSDALWAGLPIVTMIGDTFAGRVAASLLTAIGLPDLIARTPSDYEALALELARDEDRLADIRLHLEEHRLTAPLFDTHRYARNIEAAFRHMWETYQRGEKPDHFKIVENGPVETLPGEP
jgi:predicted O-linked N-acetylglucosamine transferase (SPINDLY family)